MTKYACCMKSVLMHCMTVSISPGLTELRRLGMASNLASELLQSDWVDVRSDWHERHLTRPERRDRVTAPHACDPQQLSREADSKAHQWPFCIAHAASQHEPTCTPQRCVARVGRTVICRACVMLSRQACGMPQSSPSEGIPGSWLLGMDSQGAFTAGRTINMHHLQVYYSSRR